MQMEIKSNTLKNRICGFDIINGIILIFISFITLYPIWYVFIVSVSSAPPPNNI